ncbi:NAG1_3 [Sanghuangporus vaninii]
MYYRVSLVSFLRVLCALGTTLAIWPIPRTITTGQETLLLSRNFSIFSELSETPRDLTDAIDRTKTRLFNDNLGRLVVGRGSSDTPSFNSSKTLQTLRLSLISGDSSLIKSISKESTASLDIRNESYSLNVPADGSDATLEAATTLGLLRGLTTFEQLWYTFSGQVYAVGMPLRVQDSPSFPYRGFSLDTSRNFYPISDIKRTLDAMSWVKLNTLYWHVVDSHSFPLEVSAFPELSKMGAYSTAQVYSDDDVQDVISYAAARGIDVVLELDTPGHETAIGLSHPEHVACYLASPWSEFANEPPAGQLRLATPSTLNFSVALVSSVSSKFRSTLFSTGGDEVNTNCYAQDAQTQEDLNNSGLSLDEALDRFLHETHAVIRSQGKTPIVKQDMILNHNTTLPKSTIAVVWISSQDAKNVTSRGYRMIHQPSDYFYLDCGGGGWLGNDISGNSWCDPFKTWQKIYSFDPLANLTGEESALVLGGQIPLWSEQSSPENLDPIVWPRAASAAEVFWSGGVSNGIALNVSSALPRLHDIRFRMVQRGVKATPLQPEWCAVRPGSCDIDS